MRTRDSQVRSVLMAFVGVFVAVSAACARADVTLNKFDAASEVNQWRFDFGSVSHSAVFDPTVDANNNPNSGSMKITLGFNPSLGANNKGAYTRDIFPGLDGTTFSGLQMDVKVDPNSALDAFGNNGFFGLAIRNTGNYDYNSQFGDNLHIADGWRHISVSPLTGAVNDIRGLTAQLYGGPSQNINGSITFWIDNVVFTQVPEPASLALLGGGAIGYLLHRRRPVCGSQGA